MEQLVATGKRDPSLNILRKSYLTVSGPDPRRTGADRLFNFLHKLTAMDSDPGTTCEGINALLHDRKVSVIANEAPHLAITAASNDGLVNTGRQVLDTSEIAGVVVADHIDVLGHFPAEYAAFPFMADGFLNSGAHFRDREFCALHHSIAAHIARAIHQSESRRSVFPRAAV